MSEVTIFEVQVKARDFLGQEINNGDLIVYPNRRGSFMWMRQMTVDRIVMDADGIITLYGVDENGQRTHTGVLKRCAVVRKGAN